MTVLIGHIDWCSDARTGGMLGGCAGIVHVHMGDGKGGLKPLWDIVENTPIPITQYHNLCVISF